MKQLLFKKYSVASFGMAVYFLMIVLFGHGVVFRYEGDIELIGAEIALVGLVFGV